MHKMAILQAEYARAFMQPLFDEPDKILRTTRPYTRCNR
jgi:hypothetical protein